MSQKALDWDGLFGMTKAKQSRYGIWNCNVRRLYVSGLLKILATISSGLEKVRQIGWENSGTELAVYYIFSMVNKIKIINWRKISST